MTAGQFEGTGAVPPGAIPPPPQAPPMPPAPQAPYQPWLEQAPPPMYDEGQPTTLAAPRTMRDRWKKLTGGAGAGIAVLAKLKVLAFLVKLKFLATFGVTFAAYAWIYGWKFGLGFVLLLLVHELGHMIVFKARGVDVSLPTFTFWGAYVKARPKSVYDSVLGGLAGPGVGALGALVALAIWHANDQPVYRAIAAFGFLMNLINLAPIGFLDGGHIWQGLRGKLSNGPGSARIYAMSPEQRLVGMAIYLGLIVVIGYATSQTYFQQNFN